MCSLVCGHEQGHHAATLSVLLDPLLQPQHAFYTACALLVEFNTFLLILRRRVVWGRYLEVPFALSWVALRLIWWVEEDGTLNININ